MARTGKKVTRRGSGTGSITPLKSGRFWVRVPMADGKRRSLGTFTTVEEAESVLRGAVEALADGSAADSDAMTLLQYEGRFFAWRARRGRPLNTDRSRWKLYLAEAPFAGKPMRSVTTREIQLWVDDDLNESPAQDKREERSISRQTIKHIVNLLRAVFKRAIREDVLDENPVKNIEFEREERINDPWDYLRPQEQTALITCEEIPEPERLAFAFSLGTGLRPGEQWMLGLADLHLSAEHPHVVVRRGSPGHGTKTGKVRRVPLFGIALAAARRWMELLPSYAPKNPLKLVFPTPRGCRRDGLALPRRTAKDGHQPTEHEVWRGYLEAAGIGRPIRFYDLRHTFASSLVSGFWGRRWRLEEVMVLLGHTSIEMTQRYAHLADTTIQENVAETDAAKVMVKVTRSSETSRATRDSNAGPSAPEADRILNDSASIEPTSNQLITSAYACLEAIQRGGPEATGAAQELARLVLGRPECDLARRILDGSTTWAADAIGLAQLVLGGATAATANRKRGVR